MFEKAGYSFHLREIVYFLLVLAVLFSGWQLSGNFIYFHDIRGWYFPAAVMFLLFLFRDRIYAPKKSLALFMAGIAGSSALTATLYHTNPAQTLIQMTAFALVVTFAYSIMRTLGHELLNTALLDAAVIIAVSVVCHELLHIIKPGLGQLVFGGRNQKLGFLVRAKGLLGEQSWGGIFLGPPTFVALRRKSRARHILLAAASALTFSLLTYISLLLAYGMYFLTVERKPKGRRKGFTVSKRVIVAGVALLFLFIVGFNAAPITERIKAGLYSAGLFSVVNNGGATMTEFYKMAGSVATLTVNSLVAISAIKGTHGLGVGFGNFEQAYRDFSPAFMPLGYNGNGLFYSAFGGGSLWIRAAAELGLAGLVALVLLHYYAVRRYMKLASDRKRKSPGQMDYMTAVGLGIIIMAVYCIRKDVWINLFFCLSLVMVFSPEFSGGAADRSDPASMESGDAR